MSQTVMGGLRSNQQNYQQCFIGHSQGASWRETFEQVCEEVLPTFDLKPWYADKHYQGGIPLRQKVVRMIATTRYGIYDLSYWRKNDQSPWIMPRNVLIELGMAIALNRPMLLLRHWKNRECSLTLPACLEGVSIGEFGDGKKLLKETLNTRLPSLTQHTPKQDWLNRYCHFGGLECPHRETHPQARQWGRQKIHIHISDGTNTNRIDCSDFRDMIEEDVINRFSNLEFTYLNSLTCPQGCKFLLCSHCQQVRSSPFAIYRITPNTSADTFLAIGMSIALEKQYDYPITKILITDDKQNIPSLLEGYEIIVEQNFTRIKDRLNAILPEMIEKTRQTIWKPQQLPFEVYLPIREYTEPEEITSTGSKESGLPPVPRTLAQLRSMMTVEQFEIFSAALIMAKGEGHRFNMHTGRAGNWSIDVMLHDLHGNIVAIQSKLYAQDNQIGVTEVRSFIGAVTISKATNGFFVTTSTFTNEAQLTAHSYGNRVRTMDGDEIEALLQHRHREVALAYRDVLKEMSATAYSENDASVQRDEDSSSQQEIEKDRDIDQVPDKQARDRFDKFTERARKALSFAEEEARRLRNNYIGTEHLLLGLVCEGGGVAVKVLASLGVELNQVRSAVESLIPRGDVLGEMGLTPGAKKVIELAVYEVHSMNYNYIGTEHLLLGLLREGEGIAASVLESLGITLEKARIQTIQALSNASVPATVDIDQVQRDEDNSSQRETEEDEELIDAINQSKLDQSISDGQIELFPAELRVVKNGNLSISLTRNEMQILQVLMKNSGRVVNRDQLLTEVWNDEENNTNIVDVYIRRLRRKLEADPDKPQHIISSRGIGYKFGGGATSNLQPVFYYNPVTIYLSYAVKDKALCQRFEKHLKPLERDGLLEIEHGSKTEIHSMEDYDIMLHNSKFLLPLISPDYMISESSIVNHFIEEYMQDESDIIPIILRPTNWKNTPFAHLKALPTNGVPVTQWPSQDDAFEDVALNIRRIVENLQNRP